MKLDNHIKIVKEGNAHNTRYYLGGESLAYLRKKANLPYPTTKLNGVCEWDEGQQWLLRGDGNCDLVGIRVRRETRESYIKHTFILSVLYKKGKWERLEVRTTETKGNMRGELKPNGWQPLEDVLDEFADIIMHLLDVYQVAVIK